MNEGSLERKILAASLSSRTAFDRISSASNLEEYTPYTSFLLSQVKRWYDRDDKAKTVDPDVLAEWVKQQLPTKSHDTYLIYLREAAASDVSAVNIADLVVDAKKQQISNRLAQALLDGDDEVPSLMAAYNSLEDADEEEAEESLNGVSVESMLSSVEAEAGIKLLPKEMNRYLKGRLRKGHHIVVFARPETGKTAIAITFAYALCLQGIPTIIFGNEEPVGDTIERAMACFTGMTSEEIKADPVGAQKKLDNSNWNLLRFIPLNPGTPEQIDRYLSRYKPGAFVIDQIRNLAVREDTRVNKLEAAATTSRNAAKKHNALGISITQAGDSADKKVFLEMGDVDYSNTGIPATADVMVGMGINDEYEAQGLRGISMPKNKVGGIHARFPVRIHQQLSRLEDV